MMLSGEITVIASIHRKQRLPAAGFALFAAPILMLSIGCTSQRGRTFASPQEGVSAFVAALRPLNVDELRAILGPDSDEIVFSGDEVADRNAAETFASMYDLKHDLVVEDDMATLVVGDQDWPMPIPLVSDGKTWWFDTEEGKDELLARRIGRNELAAIESCRAVVDAQREFAAMNADSGQPVYAEKFVSDPGQRNGLYWPSSPGQPESPLGPLAAEAVEAGYSRRDAADTGPRPFQGYRFRMLTAQGKSAPGGARNFIENGRMTGGFAVVAWPAEYENSGIMTFLVCHRGLVYQKDLGKNTARLAAEMSAFDPDRGWEVVP